ncbi:MAG: GNAT family N-acetyltransferase [Sphingorhabdus sp.]|uniref:GNAT family N-acetyltransferase n=1 Tax=Sphingorhabdus sp. TaxID=1902408 RepID=UPI0038FD3BAD
MTVDVRTLTDLGERRAAIPALSDLRIRIFRGWPYLYDGTADYEAEYLAEFIREPGSALVVAQDGDAIVGAATASPMAGQKPEFQEPLRRHRLDIARIFYFGESVLLPAYQGQGIGHRFFDAREAAARAAGAVQTAFCAVFRPDDHPMRPASPRDLHPFWRARGYAPVPGLTGTLEWQDVGETSESAHQMQFWMRDL